MKRCMWAMTDGKRVMRGWSPPVVVCVSTQQHAYTPNLPRNDLYGARDAGCFAWLWGLDVTSFEKVAERVISGESESDDDE